MSDKLHQNFLKSFSVLIEQNVTFIWQPPYGWLGDTQKLLLGTLYDKFIWWLSNMHVAYLDSVYDSIRAFHFVRKVVSLKCILIFWQTVSWQNMKIEPIRLCIHTIVIMKQKRSTEGCSKFKSPETRQVQERLVSTWEHMQVQKWDRTRCPVE